jgi:hypothetical protein
MEAARKKLKKVLVTGSLFLVGERSFVWKAARRLRRALNKSACCHRLLLRLARVL